jgi:hypothetical protein
MQVTNLTKFTNGTAARALRHVAIDGALGATCGGLYGLVFGGFGALVHGEPWTLFSMAINFAGWGFAVGALVGAYGAHFHADGDTGRSIPALPDSTQKRQLPVETVRRPMVPSHRPAPKSTVSATRTDRTRSKTVRT